jgi:hypothetical protein
MAMKGNGNAPSARRACPRFRDQQVTLIGQGRSERRSKTGDEFAALCINLRGAE